MCPATVWIILGLRSRRKNGTAPGSGALHFISMAPAPELLFFMSVAPAFFFFMTPAPAPASVRFYICAVFTHVPQLEWNMNQIKYTKLREYTIYLFE